ncbi:MAG TPA: Wzz/FepE/Etk N-terminal domain-containing protein [Ignavibacteriaceae bacterium]|nr:Wzz/FepE/Etk N-terminal domain-containing protein [Ignavibacteriaceae bacterium]
MKKNFSDYVSILIKWKNFIIYNLILVLLITIPLVFLIPNQYRATARIMVPQNNELGLGGLTSLIGGKTGSLGSKLLGLGSSTSEDMILGVLNSRTALTQVINQFDLITYYDIENNSLDRTIKAFQNDLRFAPNEFGLIEISVINKNSNISAEISNYFIKVLDSMSIKLNTEQARNNRLFIEKRYFQNLEDLKNAEDSLFALQKKYGIFAIPEQFEVSVKSAAELEAKLMQSDIASQILKNKVGENSPEYQTLKIQHDYLKNKVLELKNDEKLKSSSNIFFPFGKIPGISLAYLRLYRNLEIQQQILEVILPLYEQAKVEEQKSIPTVLIVDKAIPPDEKHTPRRSFIIIGIVMLFFFLFMLLSFVGENAMKREKEGNTVEILTGRIFRTVHKFYRI